MKGVCKCVYEIWSLRAITNGKEPIFSSFLYLKRVMVPAETNLSVQIVIIRLRLRPLKKKVGQLFMILFSVAYWSIKTDEA